MSKRLTNDTANAAAREAAKLIYDQRTAECAAIVDACIKAGRPEEATAMIGSGRRLEEVEKKLKASAAAKSWSAAIAKHGGRS
jgi:hypothetical protein